MARRRFNWKVAVVILIALMVLGVTAFGLRKWQRKRMGYAGLEAGLKAYENCDWSEAAKNLGRYLTVQQTDVDVMFKYAEAQLNMRPLDRSNIQQAISTYRVILRQDSDNAEAVKKLVTLYLQMGINAEAELIARRYLQANDDPEIRRFLAVSLARQRKWKEAATQLQTVIKDHPDQVPAYETLGQISAQFPDRFKKPPQHWFDEAVKNNPSSAMAFIARAGFYRTENQMDKALADLKKAEQLDLSDLQVRLRLATEFANADEFDKARAHLTEIEAQDPSNPALWEVFSTVGFYACRRRVIYSKR